MATRMVAAVIGVLLAGTAHAATIREIVIRGQGVVTLSIPGTVGGVPISPDVGTPVQVTANVFFGSGVAPSDVTGHFVCCGSESIKNISVTLSGLGNFGSFDEYNGSDVDLVDGNVSQFFLGAPINSNGRGGYISETDFQYTRDIVPVCDSNGNCVSSTFVLGSWAVSDIDIRTTAVPEPAQWMFMLIGFGLAGTQFRARQRASRARGGLPTELVVDC